jgi:hypothetical protein
MPKPNSSARETYRSEGYVVARGIIDVAALDEINREIADLFILQLRRLGLPVDAGRDPHHVGRFEDPQRLPQISAAPRLAEPAGQHRQHRLLGANQPGFARFPPARSHPEIALVRLVEYDRAHHDADGGGYADLG